MSRAGRAGTRDVPRATRSNDLRRRGRQAGRCELLINNDLRQAAANGGVDVPEKCPSIDDTSGARLRERLEEIDEMLSAELRDTGVGRAVRLARHSWGPLGGPKVSRDSRRCATRNARKHPCGNAGMVAYKGAVPKSAICKDLRRTSTDYPARRPQNTWLAHSNSPGVWQVMRGARPAGDEVRDSAQRRVWVSNFRIFAWPMPGIGRGAIQQSIVRFRRLRLVGFKPHAANCGNRSTRRSTAIGY